MVFLLRLCMHMCMYVVCNVCNVCMYVCMHVVCMYHGDDALEEKAHQRRSSEDKSKEKSYEQCCV